MCRALLAHLQAFAEKVQIADPQSSHFSPTQAEQRTGPDHRRVASSHRGGNCFHVFRGELAANDGLDGRELDAPAGDLASQSDATASPNIARRTA
jgi:hypothetical protein